MKWFIFLFSFNLYAFSYTNKTDTFSRTVIVNPPTHSSLYAKKYEKWYSEINPFVKTPYMSMNDWTVDNYQNTIYDALYTTGELGLRIIPEVKKDLPKHLIITGDSNTFGVGCADNQTLPYYLSKQFPDRSVYNFALAGTGPNSALRFLEVFSIKDFAPQNFKHGAFVLDLHTFVIQRVIGSKRFLGWGSSTPHYSLNSDGIPVYQGPFSESLQIKFYHFLDKLPYSETLFPDLPQIGERHIELMAKVIVAVKNKYLAQTSPDNKFFVIINPESKQPGPGYVVSMTKLYVDPFKTDVELPLIKKLIENKIEVLTFKPEETKELPHFPFDGHFTPEAHKNYAQMIADKIKSKI